MKDKRSRIDIILDEILSGGFTEDELQEIIDCCEEELTNLEDEEEREGGE